MSAASPSLFSPAEREKSAEMLGGVAEKCYFCAGRRQEPRCALAVCNAIYINVQDSYD